MTLRRLRWIGLAVGGLLLLYWLVPLPQPLFAPHYSTALVDRHGHLLRVFLNGQEQWHLAPQPEAPIAAKLERAVLTFEDRRFYYHPGVDPLALGRALGQNARAGRVISGASTITMQVARLMAPKARTWGHKGLEVLQALKMEVRLSKPALLQLYLDHAPYGGNIVGVEAAARKYFGKAPQALSWAEAATLAVLPNAPGLVGPVANPERLQLKRDRLLARLLAAGDLDRATYALALREPVPRAARPFPMLAPHLARHLQGQGLGPTIATTIDADIQRLTEHWLARHAVFLQGRGIANGAVLVADTRSGQVRAYAGSQDFFAAAQGQVDGVRAPRSSGSLLKPFLYALAMDGGLALPQTLVEDVPVYYQAFSPSNASHQYDGVVPAGQALVRSLNVPAVGLLKAYGIYPFHQFLQRAGVSTLFRRAEDYGLPLIIGGAEVALWDMASLYAGLANGGDFRPLQVVAGPARDLGNALISPAASYLTLEVLRQLQRPGAEYYWQQFENQWPLAWKTGTSYGQRDAWAVGVNPQWTIAVWCGNFTGAGNANLGGAQSAGPLLFDIFNALPKDAAQSWFAPPWTRAVELCADSGFMAGPHCRKKELAEAPPHMKPLAVCRHHRTVHVSADGAHQVCSLCWEPGHRSEKRLVYPVEVAQVLRRQGRLPEELPPHRPDCPAGLQEQPVQIVYPRPGVHLWRPRDFGGQWQDIVLRAAHRQRQSLLYWYLDGAYAGRTRDRHIKPVGLEKGWHVLEVVDQAGHRDRRRFYVDARQAPIGRP
ncbi:MAG: penicillin-binding protein 1C [Candidatus Latescibacteria bacterium]|nr:penicillin-binding protein 1C [Candidatus Latescibacterota bacterium]